MRTSAALFVAFSACGGYATLPSAAVQADLPPKTSTPKLVLELPADLKWVRAELRDPEQKLSATCDSLETCASLTNWLTTKGSYTLELEYVGADGVRERTKETFSAGSGELSVALQAMVDQDGVIDAMRPRITGAPIEGVLVRAGSEPVTALSQLVIVNGSKAPIFFPTQDGHALARASGVNGTPNPPPVLGCGTGIGLHELAPGESFPLGQVFAIGGRRPMARGRYRIAVQYGVDLAQEANSFGGSRSVELEVAIDGPEPQPAEPSRKRQLEAPRFTPRDPGRPAFTFVPARTEGAESIAGAPKLAFDQSVAGALTAKSPRRYFRVEPPSSMKYGAVRFYARCDAPGCKQSAYAVLTDEPDSVSDARTLRVSGGWTQLTDDARLSSEKPWFLVIGCLDGCPSPMSFFGAVTEGEHGW